MTPEPTQRELPREQDTGSVHLTPTEVRGGSREGMIKILIISTAIAAVLLLGFWLINVRHFSSITHPQVRDHDKRDIASYDLPPTGARQAPPGEPSTELNQTANVAH
ncbi:MAG: hypothetical protein ACYDD1_00230 [Caulobacteraceae bacterium]